MRGDIAAAAAVAAAAAAAAAARFGVGAVLLCAALLPFGVAFTAFWSIVPLTVVAPALLRGALRHWRRLVGKVPAPAPPAQQTWTIHGERYDLTAFLPHHPGGDWALRLSEGSDCTALFESYHIFADRHRLEKFMAAYRIDSSDGGPRRGKAGNSTGLRLNCAFYDDVRQMAREHFAGKPAGAHKMTTAHAAFACVLIAANWASVAALWAGYRASLVTLPVVGWLLVANVAHEGSHFAASTRPWVNRLLAAAALPLYYNSTAWHLQHVLSHHVYTNAPADVDLYHFLPLCRVSRLSPRKAVMRVQHVLLTLLILPTAMLHLSFTVPVDLLTGAIDVITGLPRYGQYGYRDAAVAAIWWPLLAENTLQWGWLASIGAAHGFFTGLVWMGLAYTGASLLFVAFTQGNHLHEVCFEPPGGALTDSWAASQVASSVDFSQDSASWHLVSGGLNMQGLHHLLPGVSSCHLRALYPGFRAVCKRHGVRINEASGPTAALGGFFGWVRELSRPDPAPPCPTRAEAGVD